MQSYRIEKENTFEKYLIDLFSYSFKFVLFCSFQQ